VTSGQNCGIRSLTSRNSDTLELWDLGVLTTTHKNPPERRICKYPNKGGDQRLTIHALIYGSQKLWEFGLQEFSLSKCETPLNARTLNWKIRRLTSAFNRRPKITLSSRL
jgi:hypothetical protein